MEYTADLDLEDLETRLYSQIHHNNEEIVEDETTIIPETSTIFIRKDYRYFENSVKDNCEEAQPITNSSSSEVINCPDKIKQTPVIVSPTCNVSYCDQDKEIFKNNSSENGNSVIDTYLNITAPTTKPLIPNFTFYSRQDNEVIQNNITVNQYSFPFIVNSDSFLSSESRIPTVQLNERKNHKRNEYRRRARKRKKLSKLLQQIENKQIVSEVICLSDSDDCKVMEEDSISGKINTKFPKKYNEADGDKLPEVDDDVIFIPPPPIEVINVDISEQHLDDTHPEKINVVGTSELNNSESNDFLETHVEPNNTDFNFALHGSDFNTGPTEFREPLKHIEYCETESSCSTNDHHSRNFSNTVKTIVFDEVDFPKEDIFSENNLESFSSFITPKRSSKKLVDNVNISQTPKKLSENNDVSTDTSSSESDYETSNNKNSSNLPNLSPMILHETVDSHKAHKLRKNEPSKVAEKPVKNKKGIDRVERFSKIKNTHVENEDSEFAVKRDNCSTPNSLKLKRRKKKCEKLTPVPLDKNVSEVSSSINSVETEQSFNFDVESENICDAENLKKKRKKRNMFSQVKENDALTGLKVTEPPKLTDVIEKNIDGEESNNYNENMVTLKNKKKKSLSKTDEHSKDVEDSASVEVEKLVDQSNQIHSQLFKAAEKTNNTEKLKKKKKNRESTSSENNPDETVEETVDKNGNLAPKSVQVNVENFIKNVEITTDLSLKLDAQLSKSKKKKKSEISLVDSEIDKNNQQQSLLTDPNLVESIDNTKKKRNKSEKESKEKTNDKTTSCDKTQIQIEQIKETSSSDPIVFDIINLDDSSASNQIILSSDSDVEVLSDIDNVTDITLNCLMDKNQLCNTDTPSSAQNYESFIKTTRVPLKNFEKFDVSAIQRNQSDDPQKWIVSSSDKFSYLNDRGNRGPRCNRCRHFGHISIKCPDKPHPPPCILCGEPNHQEPRCPFKMCTQCGHRGDYSTTYCYKCFKFRNTICRLCKMVGHIESTCPDLWRRYRLTTDKGPMVTTPALAKPRNQQWCSGCAKQGHLEHECSYYNRFYPPTTPFINNYEDNLEHNKQFDLNQQTAAVLPKMSSSTTNSNSVHSEISSLDSPIPLPLFPDVSVGTVQNPNAVTSSSNNNHLLFQMKMNFHNLHNLENDNIDLDDPKQIKKFIMTMPHHIVTEFIREHINGLNTTSLDPRLLKRKIFRYDRLTNTKRDLPEKILREKNHWYRLLNTFIFGFHKHKPGNFHCNYLQRYLSCANSIRLDDPKRAALFSSYNYVFGCDKHVNIDYYKILRLLIRKHYSNNRNVL